MTATKKENLFHKLIFIFSILGILTTVHLYLMNERGFDRGCFGFETSEQVEDTFDCESVIDQGLKIMGMSNIFWGFLFYSAIMALGLIPIFFKKLNLDFYKNIKNYLIIFGFLYSAYLAYHQHFIIEEYCALCLISGVISTILFILFILSPKNVKSYQMEYNKIHYIIILVIGFLFAGIEYYYFNVLNKKSEKIVSSEIESKIEDSENFECSFNEKKPYVKNYKDLISDIDIKYGNPNSDNVIIEIFDPNCTHCKKLHHEMKNIIEAFENDFFIVIKSNPLWNHSLQQIQALYIAKDYGKFDEMLNEQFERQKPGKGLNLDQLKEIADLIGLDSDLMTKRIKKADFLNHIIQENQRVRKAGITSAPTLLLNGKTIASKSRNVDCIKELLN